MSEPNKTEPLNTVSESKNEQHRILLKSPELIVLDAGCWLKNLSYFAAISGSSIAIGRVVTQLHNIMEIGSSLVPKIPQGLPLKDIDSALKLMISSCSKDDLNEPLRKLFSSHGTVVMDLYGLKNLGNFDIWIELVATAKLESSSLSDIKIGGELISPLSSLYIFIPDMHICLGKEDPCDFFSYGIDNTSPLHWFTSVVKKFSGIIIQTGDMLDFWMAEADASIYYDKEVSMEKDQLIPRVTADRIAEAARQIDLRLGNDKMVEILHNIDHYILGNHDWEMIFPCASESLNGKINKSKIMSKTNAQRINGTAIAVTHGHFFEHYNDTSLVDPQQPDSTMRLYGKSVTFDYARGKRHSDYLAPKESLDQNTIAGFLSRIYSSRDDLLDVATNFTQFNEMRYGALVSIIDSLLRNNAGYIFRLDNPSVVSFYDARRTIYWYSDKGAEFPPVVKCRILVHSHSHSPLITRIALVYDKELPAKQRSLEAIHKAVSNPNPNENPLLPFRFDQN